MKVRNSDALGLGVIILALVVGNLTSAPWGWLVLALYLIIIGFAK